ncbi:MAG: TRAP transporter permease [Gammaproteobacteria bacterium]
MQQEQQRSPDDASFRENLLSRAGPLRTVAVTVAVIGALFNIVGLNVYPLEAFILRSTFLFVASVIAFIVYPASKNDRGQVTIFDFLLIGLSASAYIYTALNYDGLMERAGVLWITPDLVVSAILVVTIIELARRTMGPALPILALVLLGYALWGPYFPGIFGHPGFGVDRVLSYVYSLDAIFGTPVGVCVTYVFVFVLFGVLMEATGGGKVLMDLAVSLTGRSRGGTAKIAIVGSSFFGTLNGSPVANVMATGAFTIPAMKKTGYRPAFAGAVEATASTGGQILPPIMGASVFIMMDILGTDYLSIAKAALIPALLYYVGVFWMVDLEARRTGVRGLPDDEIPLARDVIREGGYLLLPIAVLLYALLIAQVSPLRAGLIGALSCIAVGSFKKESRLGLKAIASALFVTMRSSIMVVAACALAGVVVGVLGLSGLGLNIANIILNYSMGLLPLALLLATVVAIILGLGMPTTASYIICAAIIAPGLVEMGVTAIGAHLFVLYFANMSNITPPVALACYGASSIAQANPLDVSIKAFKLGLVGFLIPFAWVYGPQLIMEGEPLSIVYTSVTALIGVLALGVSLQGIIGSTILGWSSRICAASVAVLLVAPGVITDGIALAVVALLAMQIAWRSPGARSSEASSD